MPYYVYPYHSTIWPQGVDYIGILSEKGFKNTGLNNGENHLKCWYKGPSSNNFAKTEYYTKEWSPDFSEAQSIMGWASTGTAQVVRLKNSGKRVPYNDWNSCDTFTEG